MKVRQHSWSKPDTLNAHTAVTQGYGRAMSRLRRRVVLGLSAVTVVTLATATPALADKGWHGRPPTDLAQGPAS